MLLGLNLIRITLRAIVIGVAALAYHGFGFDAGCTREEVMALLDHLRRHGPQSRRDLLRRFQTRDACQRDELIARLESEGLLECDGSLLRAVPLSDFIERLQVRPEFPKTGALSNLLLGRKCRMADPLPGMEEKPRKRRERRQTADQAGDAPEGPCEGVNGCHASVG